MGIPALIGVIAPIVGDVLKRVLPEDPDKAAEIERELSLRLMNSEDKIARAQADIISAEARGDSWLQRSWRPIVMLWFAGLVGAHWFGFTPPNLSNDAITGLFTLVQIGIGGYVIGRSGEKISRNVAEMVGRRD